MARQEQSTFQTPIQPWDSWVENRLRTFTHWSETGSGGWDHNPNLPKEFQSIKYEFNSWETDHALAMSRIFRQALGEGSNGVFYRPGLGFGGAVTEMVEKIGTYQTMIVADPVYEGDKMLDWSKGLTPVKYFQLALQSAGASELQTSVKDKSDQAFRQTDADPDNIFISKQGEAEVKGKINGVDIALNILPRDMTKFFPKSYNLLSFGRPTPMDSKTGNVGGNDRFAVRAIRHLQVGGLIEYRQNNFVLLPGQLPNEVFGFTQIADADSNIVVQKTTDQTSAALRSAFQAKEDIRDSYGTLAGVMPGDSWLGSIFERNKYVTGDERPLSLDDVLDEYYRRVGSLANFVSNLPGYLREQTARRIEYLLVDPISSNGSLDLAKVEQVHLIPDDPDKPRDSADRGYGPYYGRPGALIAAHNVGEIDAIAYYQNLVDIFYAHFPQIES